MFFKFYLQEKKDCEFKEKLENNQKTAEERTAKKRAKRLKKKQLAKKQKTKSQLPADDEGSESSSTSEGSQDE